MLVRTFHNNEFLLIAGTAQPQRDSNGDPIPDPTFGTVTETEVPDPETFPVVMSVAEFNDYVWSKLGGGDEGMARFQDIEDAAMAAGGAPKAAARQIDRLASFTKQQAIALFTPIQDAGYMQIAEFNSIIDGWRTA